MGSSFPQKSRNRSRENYEGPVRFDIAIHDFRSRLSEEKLELGHSTDFNSRTRRRSIRAETSRAFGSMCPLTRGAVDLVLVAVIMMM